MQAFSRAALQTCSALLPLPTRLGMRRLSCMVWSSSMRRDFELKDEQGGTLALIDR